jgi:hypothetical protein
VTFAVLADPNYKMYDAVDGRFVEKLIVGDLDGGEKELFWFKAGNPQVLPPGLTVPHDASGVNSSLRHLPIRAGGWRWYVRSTAQQKWDFGPRKPADSVGQSAATAADRLVVS